MDRRRWLRLSGTAIAVLLLAVCTACQDWTRYMGDAALDGNDAGETIIGPGNLAELSAAFAIATSSGPGVASTTSPVVASGVLFVGSGDGQGGVHLVAAPIDDSSSGCSGNPKICQPLWTASIPGSTTIGTPLVSGNVVYETFGAAASPTSGELAAFDATGTTNCSGSPKTCQPLWTATASSISGVNLDGQTLFLDSVLGSSTSSLEAFDAAGMSGCAGTPRVCQPLWTAASNALGEPSVADGKVYVARSLGTGAVEVYDESGSSNCGGIPKICQPLFTVGLPAPSQGGVDVSGGTGYVETEGDPGPPAQLVAFDATGATCTGSPAVCPAEWTGPIGGSPSWDDVPAVANGRVYASDDSPLSITAFSANGSTGCTGAPKVCQPLFTTSSSFSGLAPALVTNGLVFEGGQAFDASGIGRCAGTPVVCQALWSAPAGTPLVTSGAAVADGTLFVGRGDGLIHAYQIPGP